MQDPTDFQFVLSTNFEAQREWLFSRNPPIVNKLEIDLMYQMSKKAAFGNQERRQVWLLASGALNTMQSCEPTQSYWKVIDNYNRSFPNPNDHQIEVDLGRTFPGEEFYGDPEIVDQLRRVAIAYSVRNPEIGYCQGFNFIIGRFLKIMSEEEAFWMLTCLLESFMPIDYYSKMVGVIIDHNILNDIIQDRMPDLFEHLQQAYFDPKMVTFQWLSCLFAYNFSFHVISRIWDLFFLKGSKILFRISLAILHMMKQQIMSYNNFEDIMKVFDTIPAQLQDANSIIQVSNFPKYKLKNKEIEQFREEYRHQAFQDQQLNQQPIKRIGTQDPGKSRLNFLNKFFMYSSIQKTTMSDKLFNNQIYQQADLIDYLTCDQSWPVCIFDFSFQQKLPQYFVYKVKEFPPNIIENHFYGEDNEILPESMLFQSKVSLQSPIKFNQAEDLQDGSYFERSLESNSLSSFDEIQYMIEEAKLMSQRNPHYCNQNLIKHFRRLVRVDTAELFFWKKMALEDITDDKKCREQILELIEFINQLWPENQKFHKEVVSKFKLSNRALIETKSEKPESIFYEFEPISFGQPKRRSGSPQNPSKTIYQQIKKYEKQSYYEVFKDLKLKKEKSQNDNSRQNQQIQIIRLDENENILDYV